MILGMVLQFIVSAVVVVGGGREDENQRRAERKIDIVRLKFKLGLNSPSVTPGLNT